jgi:Cu-processing system permease protein
MRALRTIAIVAANGWQDSLRSRFFMLSALFGGVTLYVSVILGMLAADQETRVLLDFGLSLIELIGLAAAAFGAATIVLREIETKTIYLVLTRPVSRAQYLLGRFAGLMLSVAACMGLMAVMHLSILLAKGWSWSWLYAAALAGSYMKLVAVAALTLFLALWSSSILTALVIAGVCWALGHFLPEIRFMLRFSTEGPALAPLTALSYVLPDLQRLNLRDRLLTTRVWAAAFGYAAAYASVWLALAAAKLKRKEF